MSLAFYTGFFGGDSNWAAVIPPLPTQNHPCFYFTNNTNIFNRLESTGWRRVWLDIPIYNDNNKDAMASKELRCCPERFTELQGYSYLCWIDSKIAFTSWDKFTVMLESLHTSTAVLAATAHPLPYKTVWDEYETAIQYEKYAKEKESYKRYIEEELTGGASPDKPQRICCGFRLMKMSDKRRCLGETWLSHIHRCGIEDQISWQFVHQLFEEDIVIFPYQYCWKPL